MGSKTTTQKGFEAEEAALEWLISRGLRLLARNYRTRWGEVDLVMQERDVIVFVEVRLRFSVLYAPAAETIVKRKQQRIQKAAEHFLLHYVHGGRFPDCRFDVMASDGKQWQWIRNAFNAS